VSWICGKKAARADSTLKLEAASCASACTTSGRCRSSSEGMPGVTRGTASFARLPSFTVKFAGARASSKAKRGAVLAHDDLQRGDRGALGRDQRLLLRDFELRCGSARRIAA
jgi:hypothetical protein